MILTVCRIYIHTGSPFSLKLSLLDLKWQKTKINADNLLSPKENIYIFKISTKMNSKTRKIN